MMNQLEFARVMNYVAEAYGVTLSQTRLNIYFDKLKNYDLELLKQVVSNLIAQDNYFPSVARLVGVLNDQLVPELRANPTNEWLDVMDAVRSCGRLRAQQGKARLSDMARKVVDDLGWSRLCDADQFTLAHFERQFKQLFTREQDRVREELLVEHKVVTPVSAGGVKSLEPIKGGQDAPVQDKPVERVNLEYELSQIDSKTLPPELITPAFRKELVRRVNAGQGVADAVDAILRA